MLSESEELGVYRYFNSYPAIASKQAMTQYLAIAVARAKIAITLGREALGDVEAY